MLQIKSSKFYACGLGWPNNLLGVLYCNLGLIYGLAVVATAGPLRETDNMSGSRTIVFEIEETIEIAEVEPCFLSRSNRNSRAWAT